MILKKGDRIRFWDQTVGLVLNDGMKGIEYVKKYDGKAVWYFESSKNQVIRGRIHERCTHSHIIDPGKELVYYLVLKGDREVWVRDIVVGRPIIEKL